MYSLNELKVSRYQPGILAQTQAKKGGSCRGESLPTSLQNRLQPTVPTVSESMKVCLLNELIESIPSTLFTL